MVPPPNALALYIVRASCEHCNPSGAHSEDRNGGVTFCDCLGRHGTAGKLIYPRYRMVQSSRLEQVRLVCFQLVEPCSNSRSSRLAVCFRETLIAVLEPVRNFSAVCFERVTSISVCESEPVRNGLRSPSICNESGRASLGVLSFPIWEPAGKVTGYRHTCVSLLCPRMPVAAAI